MTKEKTLYLWDLADTLFGEEWETVKTGLKNYNAYIKSLGYNLETIDPLTYERQYEVPFKQGLMKLSILPGFKETLAWTKHNAVFTTGNKEQIAWRTEVFLKRGKIDIRPFFERIYTTFDFGRTNKKTQNMYAAILAKEFKRGYQTVVYADNSLPNCQACLRAARAAQADVRVYHIAPRSHGPWQLRKNFFRVKQLKQLLANERRLAKVA